MDSVPQGLEVELQAVAEKMKCQGRTDSKPRVFQVKLQQFYVPRLQMAKCRHITFADFGAQGEIV